MIHLGLYLDVKPAILLLEVCSTLGLGLDFFRVRPVSFRANDK